MVMTIRAERVRLAHLQDIDRRRIERVGLLEAGRIGLATMRAAQKAWREDRDVAEAIREASHDRLAELFVDGMVLAHVTGRHRGLREFEAHLQGRREFSVYDDATQFVQRRMNLSTEDLAGLRTIYGANAVRVTREASAVLERRAQLAVATAIETGAHVREGSAMLREAFEAAGVTARKPYLYETLFRTQTQIAYSAGRMNVNTDPDIDEILWGYDYVTVGDDRVRPSHAALDGTRYAKNSPRLAEITPPNGFNCRCALIAVFDKGTEKLPPDTVMVDGAEVRPLPDPGWFFNPGALFQDTISVL